MVGVLHRSLWPEMRRKKLHSRGASQRFSKRGLLSLNSDKFLHVCSIPDSETFYSFKLYQKYNAKQKYTLA